MLGLLVVALLVGSGRSCVEVGVGAAASATVLVLVVLDASGSMDYAAGSRRDPERPVWVIGSAVSGEADYRSLRQVAEATGGAAYRAEDPQDILEVFAQAISAR